jgi:hypothetical protein
LEHPRESQQKHDGMIFSSPFCHRLLFGLLLALVASRSALTVEPPAAVPDAIEPTLAQEVEQALAALDADEFAIRGKAVQQLERWIDQPRLASFLSQRFARILHSPDTSVEVCERIESLARRLPAVGMLGGTDTPPDAARAQASEIVPLLDRLASDSSVERASTQRRLRSMLEHVELIGPMWVELKRRAADPALTFADRRELEPLLDKAREAWLLANPADVPLPPVSTRLIVGWIENLTQLDESDPLNRFRRALAERELLDAIARDDARPEVLKILAEGIAAAPDAATSTTLTQIADFARPAMAAEVWGHEPGNWDHRQHRTVQYLIVGLPQFNEMAQRATHFDSIDERTAHCVTGNSLTEGNYPVGVAIPHPDPTQDVMFYLTNLPTPRRRLAYEFQIERDETARLREISQRTVDDILRRQRVLDEAQTMLLAQLDPQVVSRFVGPYLRAVPDRRLVTSNSELAGQSTVHRGICYMMTRVGTRDAVPALEELGRSGRLETSFESPSQIAWIAALAIAGRDPWPGVDEWLAKLIDLKTPLVTSGELPPELGASAAALLLDRHGASTRPFGLEISGEALTERLRFIGYRFGSDRDRADVNRWWERQKSLKQREMAP